MTVIAEPETGRPDVLFEDLSTGVHASGFGQIGDGRSFSFGTRGTDLWVALFRAGHSEPVPQPEDLLATARRSLLGIDLADERSLAAAVRDMLNTAR